jgi:glucose/arabinose dehydrogenase
MLLRVWKFAGAAVVLSLAVAAVAVAASSSGPKTPAGKKAQLVASGVGTPTGFAFGHGQVFMSDGTPPSGAPGVGGVYVLKNGKATKLPGSPLFSFGVVFHKGTLYVSAVNELQAWSGWNGTGFTTQKVIYTGPAGFPGFNGLAFGADGRLYAGVDVGQTNDHGPAIAPYQYDVLSFKADGSDLKVVAKGIRQPWQFAFPKGSSSPFVSDLGQDAPANLNAPDFVLRVKHGQNYGFPACTQKTATPCKTFAKPFQTFAPHSDPMGLAIVGNRLFISEFGGSTAARVISIPLAGGKARVELSGFPKGSNIVGLGVHGKWVYVGKVASSATSVGAVYRFKVK